MAWAVILLLLMLIFFGMPIGFALMISASIAMAMSGIDLIMAPIQLFSGVNKVILLAIPLFIFMGELMGATSISDRIIGLARALVGWMRGGLAHVNVVTSMFMAEMSGSAVADAAVMSKIFVPSMEKQGYPKTFSAAIMATSATLGIIIPPSIPMVLYGVTTNTSIKDPFIAGIIPGLLLGGAFMITSYIFARKEGHPVDERFEPGHLVLPGKTLNAISQSASTSIVLITNLPYNWFLISTSTRAGELPVCYSKKSSTRLDGMIATFDPQASDK